MKRIFQIAAAVLVTVLVVGLYRAKTEAGAARTRVRALETEIAETQADIRALRAEAATLESPARIEGLARRELHLTPGAAARAQPESALDAALPPPRAPSTLAGTAH
ncbi:MAG: hypothetical protein AB7L65_05330 [Hyphomonadaceae bacterium]